MKLIHLLWATRQRPQFTDHGRCRVGLSESTARFAVRPLSSAVVGVSTQKRPGTVDAARGTFTGDEPSHDDR